MNSLLIRISPTVGSLPAAITETTYMTGRGGGEKIMGRYRMRVIAKNYEICKVRKSETVSHFSVEKKNA